MGHHARPQGETARCCWRAPRTSPRELENGGTENATENSPGSRYKNGTSSCGFCALRALPYRALRCDRCLVITMFWNLFAPFYGANAGSNPAGAPYFQRLTRERSRLGLPNITSQGFRRIHHSIRGQLFLTFVLSRHGQMVRKGTGGQRREQKGISKTRRGRSSGG